MGEDTRVQRIREFIEPLRVAPGTEVVLGRDRDPADTGNLDRLRELPGEVGGALGPIDILVTNTGGPPGGGAACNIERSISSPR